MRLSCGDHSFGTVSFETSAKIISLLDLDAMDVVVFGGGQHISTHDVLDDADAVAGRIHAAAAAAEVGIGDLFTVPGGLDFERLALNHPAESEREAARELFLALLVVAQRLGLSGLSMVPGVPWTGEGRTTTLGRTADELAWRVGVAGDRGLRFSIEAHVGAVVDTPEAVGELLDLVPGLQLTLDYSHFMYAGAAQSAMDALIPYARHYHARGATSGRAQVPMAQNTIDFAAVTTAMAEERYDGGVCLEYVNIDWERCNEVDVVAETTILRDRFRELVQG